jgi:hypothetical protein
VCWIGISDLCVANCCLSRKSVIRHTQEEMGGVWTYVQRPTGYSARLAKPSPKRRMFLRDLTGRGAVRLFGGKGLALAPVSNGPSAAISLCLAARRYSCT